MKRTDAFSTFHPVINLLYFLLVLVFSMCLMHPACLAISLFSALCYSAYLNGVRQMLRSFLWLIPVMLFAAILNPLFSHEGVTILRYFPNGNPLTLESILYGLAAAVMLASVISWFGCYSIVMCSDKFMYLFGRIIPSLSLLLSMTLRFVPKFKAQLSAVRQAQKMIGRDGSGNIFQKVRCGITNFSILLTWALENAVDTADSMKSRGYGLPGRTAFSIYRFDSRDRLALLWLLFCGVYLISGWIVGGFDCRYYPRFHLAELTPFSVSFLLVYAALCLTPVILDRKEDLTWTHLQSNI
ncbi:MAG: energy-coupling factor transporter transmembrane protein EcfT [Clostridia bacterium]|nr:energy-coupling factor transporter transmembrane protein EcfT [Clostridia bacterium]